ncbi:hypothetical protein [Vibrio cholerae]|uniref:hypothetical protein n=1 Tax=Vibrio cholerae TaxID=666 RepID=UPI001ECD9280|nr:hypothetical protein [Vibrio cholerae]EGQ7944436.1 hypothetical protein [Vibrio cholerae]MDV2398092.1 hypothetical protein [Vibrio cholerae]
MKKVELTVEQQQQQLEGRKEYQFFEGPMLDVYGFCFWLHESLVLDGFSKSDPNEVMNLFLELAEPHLKIQDHILEVPINGMTPEMYACYPEGKTILLHVSPMVFFVHDFIYDLGNRYLGIAHQEKVAMFSYWIERKHIYTFTFLHTMFAQFRNFMKQTAGYRDYLINLHVSVNFKSTDDYLKNIQEKNELHRYATGKISIAIKDEYFLEAITLIESIVTDRLSMAMYVRGYNSKSKSFNQLLVDSNKLIPKDLGYALDSWRKKRNIAIHNLVRTSPIEKQLSPKQFSDNAKDVAIEGSKLVNDIDGWFDSFIGDEMSPFNIRIREFVQ